LLERNLIQSWVNLRKGYKNEVSARTNTDSQKQNELLLNQISETVNRCSQATREAIDSLAENTNHLINNSSTSNKLFETAEIKNIPALLARAISLMDDMVKDSDDSKKELGCIFSNVSDSLRSLNELSVLLKDKQSHLSTTEIHRNIEQLIQLVNDTKVELAKVNRRQ
jgi:predicted HAD superfamily phosphohydrolase